MASQIELIERWQQAGRVLDALSPHERQNHWDMSTWGTKTDCGTVACAAGHCGLDAWFQARGFKMTPRNSGGADISDVPQFFGFEGARAIFFNSAQRHVEQVLDEVRAHAAWLQTAADLSIKIGAPAIGESWLEQGGIFAGVMRDSEEGAPYAAIVGPEHDDYLNWDDSMSWAASLQIDGHADYSLPSRQAQARLIDTAPQLFKREAYWSSEQHASGSGCAWFQDFDGGSQNNWHKDSKIRARAVRRLTI
jgi:hypothetical protein